MIFICLQNFKDLNDLKYFVIKYCKLLMNLSLSSRHHSIENLSDLSNNNIQHHDLHYHNIKEPKNPQNCHSNIIWPWILFFCIFIPNSVLIDLDIPYLCPECLEKCLDYHWNISIIFKVLDSSFQNNNDKGKENRESNK